MNKLTELNEDGIITKKELLTKCFEEAIKDNKKYIAVKIEMQGFEKPEVIINQTENFKTKLEYYNKAYNEDLTLKTFNGIKIIGFTSSNSYEKIEIDIIN